MANWNVTRVWLPKTPGIYIVKTYDGIETRFHYTGSAISGICMADQYEYWLEVDATSIEHDNLTSRKAKIQ